MFSIKEIGAKVKGNAVTFGIYLPNITHPQFDVKVFYIPKVDQFNPDVKAIPVELKPVQAANPLWGVINKNLWQSERISLQTGSYLYRYEITGPAKSDRNQKVRSIFFGDPAARETSSGVFSVFTIGGTSETVQENPEFRVPSIRDSILYELNVAEFNHTFQGIIDRIPYFKSLGVNVLELLPITSVPEESQWGYTPVFYFAPEERFGGPSGLKQMVAACHRADIAVILDMVFPHSDQLFPYRIGYERFFDLWVDHQYDEGGITKHSPNPIVCDYERYGKKNDFRMQSAREFFGAVCKFWIEEYGIDGFRFDHVNGYLDTRPPYRDGAPHWDSYRPTFKALQNLTIDNYKLSSNFAKFPRFRGSDGTSTIIQIAEDLDQGNYQLVQNSNSAINGCWEEKLYHASTDMALCNCLNGNYGDELLMRDSRWQEFTGLKKVGNDTIATSPVIYNNCHDKSYLMYRLDKKTEWDSSGFEHTTGTENMEWWKLQPYAIALLTAVGTPMLWQGEELAQSYGIPSNGMGRVRGTRFMRWDYFYSPKADPGIKAVLPLTDLYRNLGTIRNANPIFRGPRENAKLEMEDFDRRLLIYRRWLGSEVVIVALNFSDSGFDVSIPFGHRGVWKDILDERYNTPPYMINVQDAAQPASVHLPPYFGRIFALHS